MSSLCIPTPSFAAYLRQPRYAGASLGAQGMDRPPDTLHDRDDTMVEFPCPLRESVLFHRRCPVPLGRLRLSFLAMPRLLGKERNKERKKAKREKGRTRDSASHETLLLEQSFLCFFCVAVSPTSSCFAAAMHTSAVFSFSPNSCSAASMALRKTAVASSLSLPPAIHHRCRFPV